MTRIPRFVSFVAIAVGSLDLIRGLAHTVFVRHAATELAGLDLTGPTGRDQLVLMIAFGASNLITGAALITFGLTNRRGSLLLLAVVPVAYLIAGVSLDVYGADLVGQGIFKGTRNMRVYLFVCVLSVVSALVLRLRTRGAATTKATEADRRIA